MIAGLALLFALMALAVAVVGLLGVRVDVRREPPRPGLPPGMPTTGPAQGPGESPAAAVRCTCRHHTTGRGHTRRCAVARAIARGSV